MNFLQRLTSKSAAPDSAYGSVSTAEDEHATTSPYVDSLQDADNLKFQHSSNRPAVVIKDKLTGSPFLEDSSAANPSPAQAIKATKSNSGQLQHLMDSLLHRTEHAYVVCRAANMMH